MQKEKICKKNLDMIVANDVTLQGAGFNSDTNIVKFLFPDGEVRELEQMTKAEVAERAFEYCSAFAQIVNSINSFKRRINKLL